LIRDECQVDVLNKVLELCVSVEKYEEAATVRDILNGIVDIN
jgi:protein-arginine kinase activator protein McsA